MRRLDDDQVARYHRDGYVLHNQPVLPDADFARLREIFEEDLTRFSERELDMIHTRDERLPVPDLPARPGASFSTANRSHPCPCGMTRSLASRR